MNDKKKKEKFLAIQEKLRRAALDEVIQLLVSFIIFMLNTYLSKKR
jgi:hypothetical protein